jgi:hypothetical protein
VAEPAGRVREEVVQLRTHNRVLPVRAACQYGTHTSSL